MHVGVLRGQHLVEHLDQHDLVPNRPNADAISVPEAPAPTTASFALLVQQPLPSVSNTRPSKLVPGIGSATDPVAITTFLVSTSLSSTVILPLPARAPAPSQHFDLVLLHQPPRRRR